MLIVANWKAYVDTRDDAKKLFAAAKRAAAKSRDTIVLAPPAPYLGMLAPGNRTKVKFAAQDVSDTKVGKATGEISAAALRSLGVDYVIVGHSERRARGESDVLIVEKIQRALVNGLIPVLCVGEKARDEDAQYLHELRRQLAAAFSSLAPKEALQIVIAYEPLWAIGKSAEDAIAASDLSEMVLYIRKVLADYLPGHNASKTKVLYGGSVEPGNIRAIASGTGVDGFLVGHASVEPATFAALVKAVS